MNNNVGKVFSSRLGQLMQKGVDGKKVTQQDLATATGYTRQAISQYLDGSVLPNIEKLYTFAKYFNVSADYLVGLTDTPTTDGDVRFIGDYTGLSENTIESLHAFAAFGHPVIRMINALLEDSANVTVLTAADVIGNKSSDELKRSYDPSFSDSFVCVERNTLLEALFSYMDIDFKNNADKFMYISANGNIINPLSPESLKPMTHWKDVFCVAETSPGEIAEQVLRNRIIDAIKKFKESYNPDE